MEINSTKLTMHNKFCTKKILDIFQTIKQFDGKTYICCNYKIIDGENLPRLVSFLLTLQPKTNIKIIAEGRNVHKHLSLLKDMMTKSADYMKVNPKTVLISKKTMYI
ncbi:HPr family phosphocarrier protein [Neobacillus sp. D3-1R]|uniref:HPr family phosphocarrier protein n=1 Tax=Neobacillus sp. D3-1R TaxID=3445778 RepID=UPI003FA06F2B